MRHKCLLAGLLVGLMAMTGCGYNLDSISENTMTIKKDGTIVDVSVEDYSDGNYSMTDLETFITDEITAYNDKNGENCVVMNRLDTDNNIGKLQLTYSGMKDYNGFNHTDYELAELSDTTISGSFISAADGSSVAAPDIQEAGLQVLKVCDAMNIISKKKVLYYNSFVTEQDGTYIISGEGDAVLILK